MPVERLRAALALGVTTFGENRVQEAEAKVGLVSGASWELVGRLQSNKAARAIDLFDAIHSVDSLDLAERLDRLAREKGRAPYPVYIQVNIDADPAKSGFSGSAVVELAPRLAALPGLEIRGLMTVGLLVDTAEETRPTFRALRQLNERLRSREPQLGTGLSMGMSDDFEVAVEEGATLVRLGRALFGERPSP